MNEKTTKATTAVRFTALLGAAAAVALTLGSTGCNTVEGAADDVKGAGKATVETTERVLGTDED